MASTQIYTCDLCKQSKGKNDLSNLRVTSSGIRIENGIDNYAAATSIGIDVCGECLRKKGFIVKVKKPEETKKAHDFNARTLEQKLLDILEDLGVSFLE
ncbi:hypothetical protein LQZ18_04100 [Lachnospiraceae bacterium ZAX-1]